MGTVRRYLDRIDSELVMPILWVQSIALDLLLLMIKATRLVKNEARIEDFGGNVTTNQFRFKVREITFPTVLFGV